MNLNRKTSHATHEFKFTPIERLVRLHMNLNRKTSHATHELKFTPMDQMKYIFHDIKNNDKPNIKL